MPHAVSYDPGGLIQERENLHSSWNVVLLELNFTVGRVESYVEGRGKGVKWRSLDHWYHDFRQGYATRDAAAQELLDECPRTVELIERMRAHRAKQPLPEEAPRGSGGLGTSAAAGGGVEHPDQPTHPA